MNEELQSTNEELETINDELRRAQRRDAAGERVPRVDPRGRPPGRRGGRPRAARPGVEQPGEELWGLRDDEVEGKPPQARHRHPRAAPPRSDPARARRRTSRRDRPRGTRSARQAGARADPGCPAREPAGRGGDIRRDPARLGGTNRLNGGSICGCRGYWTSMSSVPQTESVLGRRNDHASFFSTRRSPGGVAASRVSSPRCCSGGGTTKRSTSSASRSTGAPTSPRSSGSRTCRRSAWSRTASFGGASSRRAAAGSSSRSSSRGYGDRRRRPAAREKAQLLRLDAWTLRLAAQQNLRVSSARKERALATAAAAARAQGAVPLGSPWSRLDWLRDEEALSDVLVLVD